MSGKVQPTIPFWLSSESLAGLVYGVITAMAVIAALADADANVLLMAGAAIGTSLVLALNYVYAHWLAGSYADKAHGGSRVAWRFELPTLLGAVLLGVLMLLEKLAGVPTVAAAESTMWVGTALLFVLGYRIALYGGHGRIAALGYGVIDALIGASLVLLKVLVH
jgi:hypothetical protein